MWKSRGAEIPGWAIAASARAAGAVITLISALLLLAGAAAPASPQSIPAGIELGAGLAQPIGAFDDAGGRPGLLAAVDIVVALHPRLGAYAGYRWVDYDCPDAPCPSLATPVSLTEAGWGVGLDLGFPPRGSLTPRVRAGIVLHRLGFAGNEAPVELGFELGAGVEIALAQRVAVTPRLRYLRWDSDAPDGFGSAGSRLTVSHLSIGVGLRFRPFG